MGKKGSKKRSFSRDVWPKILPLQADLSARFCYFLDLQTWAAEDNPQIPEGLYGGAKKLEAAKRKIAGGALNKLNNIGDLVDLNDSDQETIRSAVEFLGKVADSERKKETAIISQYAEDLKNKLPNILKNNSSQDISNLIKELESFAAHPDMENIEDFYKKLTISINTIRNGAQETKSRLEQLLSTQRKTYQDLTKDNYLYRMGSDFDGLIKNFIGLKARKVEDSFASLVQELVIKFVVDNIDGLITEENFWGATLGLMADFMQFLQSNKDVKNIFDDFSDLMTKNVLDNLWDNYIKQDTIFLQSLRSHSRHIEDINDAAKELLGIKQIVSKKGLEEREKELKKRGNTKKGVNYGKELMKQNHPDFYDEVIKNTDFIRWNANKKEDSVKQGRAGSIYELVRQAITSSLKVSGHAATDLITINIGSLIGDINFNMQDIILNGLDPMRKAIEDFEKEERTDRFEGLQKDFESMNNDIYNALKDLDKVLELDAGKKLFIYHESLKLYVRIEEHEVSSFEGRSLNALSAVDRLLSMNTIDNLTMPDQEILYNLILNIPEYAIGNELKDPLEQYLSIFAGLLMFDDIQNIAKEAATNAIETIEYSNLNNIHLYLLNNIYVPSSMILTYIYKALLDGATQISSKNAAKVKLDTSKANAAINNHTPNWGDHIYPMPDWEDYWSDAAEEVGRGVKLNIIFLSSFITFLRSLQDLIH